MYEGNFVKNLLFISSARYEFLFILYEYAQKENKLLIFSINFNFFSLTLVVFVCKTNLF